ncbi:hypothetical protein CYMTET_53592 [Cymbomonas tetramitiformis]|uniref:Uncharacterized protein n=1 Tax=Cymbomonas tetramitiformis TaxID=36881 RepID=A0AAE0EPW9_9CHLO|nr:hypothetical protein CYMTET_53592 [Cymbomonas tetramitiformis]
MGQDRTDLDGVGDEDEDAHVGGLERWMEMITFVHSVEGYGGYKGGAHTALAGGLEMAKGYCGGGGLGEAQVRMGGDTDAEVNGDDGGDLGAGLVRQGSVGEMRTLDPDTMAARSRAWLGCTGFLESPFALGEAAAGKGPGEVSVASQAPDQATVAGAGPRVEHGRCGWKQRSVVAVGGDSAAWSLRVETAQRGRCGWRQRSVAGAVQSRAQHPTISPDNPEKQREAHRPVKPIVGAWCSGMTQLGHSGRLDTVGGRDAHEEKLETNLKIGILIGHRRMGELLSVSDFEIDVAGVTDSPAPRHKGVLLACMRSWDGELRKDTHGIQRHLEIPHGPAADDGQVSCNFNLLDAEEGMAWDLVRGLLMEDPEERYSIDLVLSQHPYLKLPSKKKGLFR